MVKKKKKVSNKSTGRNYKKEYANYQGSEKQKKQRAQRNAARRKTTKAGRTHKGDGKDVAHKDNNTKNNKSSNLAVQTKKKNRSFKRTKTAKRKKK